MAVEIKMPKMSDTMTDGVIAEWHKKVGDKIKSGDILADVETDKATMELENFEDGVLLHIAVGNGETAPVDGTLAIVGKEGEDISAMLNGGGAPPKPAPGPAAAPAAQTAAPAPEAPAPSPTPSAQAPVPTGPEQSTPNNAPANGSATGSLAGQTAEGVDGDGRLKASPLAKRIASELGIDLDTLQGTGDGGRIVRRDVESAQAQPSAKPDQETAAEPSVPLPQTSHIQPTNGSSFEDRPINQMRKTIARRLAESKFTAPHFYLTIDVPMERAKQVREQLNGLGGEAKVSYNDLVVKASAMALRKHPAVNSSWLGDVIRTNHDINIGIAVAVEDGLLVPVVRNADGKSLTDISTEVRTQAGKAREKKLQPADWEGNTFTISNLGMMGIEEFTAIINPPDACILAVGAIREVPVVRDGAVVPGLRMKLTLSCDHRIVDGATGAAFLQTLQAMLEEPMRMLL